MKEWKQLLCLNLALVLLLTVLPVPVLAEDVIDAAESIVEESAAEVPAEEVPEAESAEEIPTEEAPAEEVPVEEIPVEEPAEVIPEEEPTEEAEVILAADHTCEWDSWEVGVEPTEQTAGSLVRSCTVEGCGETQTEELPVLKRENYRNVWTETDENGVVWANYEIYRCGKWWEFRVVHSCTLGDWYITRYPGEQSTGYAYRECEVCWDSREEVQLPTLGSGKYTVTREVDENNVGWTVYTYENVTFRKQDLPVSGETESGCPWSVNKDGLLTIGEENVEHDLWYNDVPWAVYAGDVLEGQVLGTVNATDCYCMFQNMNHVETIDLSGLKTDQTYNMNSMFAGCWNLKELDVSGFDTSNVEMMGNMFANCESLTELDLSHFDTAQVHYMQGMFGGCWDLEDLNLSGFDTSKVETMRQMFTYCDSLSELDLRSFTMTQLTDASQVDRMFERCSAETILFTDKQYGDAIKQHLLDEGYTLSVEEMDGQKVAKFTRKLWEWEMGMNPTLTSTGYGWMTKTTTGNSYRINLPALNDTDYTVTMDEQTRVKTYAYALPEYDTTLTFTLRIPPCSDVTADGMAWEVTEAGELILGKTGKNSTFNAKNGIPWADCAEFITSVKVAGPVTCTNVRGMFQNLDNLKTVNVSGLQTGSAEDFGFMFSGCTALQEIKGLNTLNTASATNMCRMFFNCYSLTELDVSGFNTANVTRMDDMFYSCEKLTELDVSGFATGNVTDMSWMFQSCFELEKLDPSGFDTANVTGMTCMFQNCQNLTELDLSGFDTAKVVDMSRMFQNCSSLTELDVSSFQTTSVVNAQQMFGGCYALTELDLRSFDLNRLQSGGADNMFQSCGVETVRTMENWGTLADQSLKAEDFVQTEDDEGWLYTRGSHNWGQWELYVAPTATAGGSIVRTCLSNETHRDLVTLPVLNDVDYTVTVNADKGVKLYTWEQGDQTITFAVELLPVSGEFNGCPWEITAEGTLIIGNADGTKVTLQTKGNVPNWSGYAAEIKSVRVLEGVKGGSVLSNLFSGLCNVESMNLEALDTTDVVNMYQMFRGCSGLKSIDLSTFSTDSLQQMSYMFWGCSGLTSLDLSGFDTSLVTATNGLFSDCTALETVNLSGWDTSKTQYMVNMFYNCAMKQLDLRELSFASMASNAFNGCCAEEILVKKANLPAAALKMAQEAGYVAETVTMDQVECYRLTLGECRWFSWYVSMEPSQTYAGSLTRRCQHGHEETMELPILSDDGTYTVQETTNEGQTFTIYERTVGDMKFSFIVQHPPITVTTDGLRWQIDEDGRLTVGETGTAAVLKVFASFNNLCPWSDYGTFVTAVELKGELDSGREARNLLGNLKNVETVDLTGLDTRNERDLSGMFAGLSKLTALDLSMLDTRKVAKADDMFTGCGASTIKVGENWGDVTHQAALAAGYEFDAVTKTYSRSVTIAPDQVEIQLPEGYVEPAVPTRPGPKDPKIDLNPTVKVVNDRPGNLTGKILCVVYDKFGRFVTMDIREVEVPAGETLEVTDLNLSCAIMEIGEVQVFLVDGDMVPIRGTEQIPVTKK